MDPIGSGRTQETVRETPAWEYPARLGNAVIDLPVRDVLLQETAPGGLQKETTDRRYVDDRNQRPLIPDAKNGRR